MQPVGATRRVSRSTRGSSAGIAGIGGVAATCTVAVALCPPLAAVTVTVPAERAVTTPVGETAATSESELSQVTGWSANVRPFVSRTVALRARVCPTSNELAEGVSRTEATTGGFTMTRDVSLFPSAEATTRATPRLVPVTSPVPETDARAESALDHVTSRLASGAPAESFTAARSCVVPPSGIRTSRGVTATVATGTSVAVTATATG